jgi:glycosyltransferase involved in cell wall biosynthesis
LSQATRRRLCLNECLFYNRRISREVRSLAVRVGADIVVADMIRTYKAAASTGLPVILDLDDLLSERYRELAAAGADRSTILGYFGDRLPHRFRRPAAMLATKALSTEAGLARRRELAAAKEAAVTCLVSRQEAEFLSTAAGRPVYWAPMAVPVGAQPAERRDSPNAVFVGGLDYAPNRSAIAWYRDEIVPRLTGLGLGSLTLDVIGHRPTDAADQLKSERIRFLGYVPDLAEALSRYRVAAIPVVSGTGIKTKVLEAMAAGLVVVSTPKGLSGLPVVDRRDAFVGESPADFARALAEAWRDVDQCAVVAKSGQEMVARDFSPAAADARWRAMLDQATVAPNWLRVLFMNDYDMERALSEWRRGDYPGQHLFGMTDGASNGIELDILPFARFHHLKAFSARRVGDLDQQLRVLFHRRRYDVLYSGSQYDTMVLAVLRRLRLFRRPIVATVHHLATGVLARPRVFRLMFGGHDRLLCMSRDIYDQLHTGLGLPADRLELVEWAVDLDLYRPSPPSEPEGERFIISAGKTKRDFQLLAEALGGSGHPVHIYCSAESAPRLDPSWSNIEVRFDQERPDQSEALPMSALLEEYRRSLAVAIPLQATETRGTTGLTSLLEALAMGRPVVMTQNSFMDIEGAGVGMSVAPGDANGWRDAIERLYAHPEDAEAMGRRARAVAEERFGLAQYSIRVARVLHEVSGRTVGNRRSQ